MDMVSLVGIAVGLAMDAFAVCITNGAVCKRENVNARFALRLAVSFGFFQAMMPMIGWLIGKAGESLISSVDHWIALILLGYLEHKARIAATRPPDWLSEHLRAKIQNACYFTISYVSRPHVERALQHRHIACATALLAICQ